jgi:hypothetical protein
MRSHLLGRERRDRARGLSKGRIRRIRSSPRWSAPEQAADRGRALSRELAAVEVELKALEMTQLRVVAAERHRTDNKPDPASSILKIKGSKSSRPRPSCCSVVGRTPCRTSPSTG